MSKSLPFSDGFKETNGMQKPALWHSELEWMSSTEIYAYIWVKRLSALCPKRSNSYTTDRLWVLAPEYFFLE